MPLVTRWKQPESKPPTSERPTSESGSLSWPTPTVCGNYNRAGASSKSGDGLATAVAMWPTPTAARYGSGQNGDPGDGRGAYAQKGKASLDTLARREGGQLNPDWVEAVMGAPLGWTNIDGPPAKASSNSRGNRPAPRRRGRTDGSG